MTIDRNKITLGDGNTTINTTWENEIVTDINNLLDNVVDFSFLHNYMKGLNIKKFSDSIIQIDPGVCVSDDNTAMMVLDKPVHLNIDNDGLLGKSNHTLTNDTIYYVWILTDKDSNYLSAITSDSSSSPQLVGQFTKKRLIGAFLYKSSKVWPFYSIGKNNVKEFHYVDSIQVLTNGNPADNTDTDVDVSSYVENDNKLGIFTFQGYGISAPSSSGTTIIKFSNPDITVGELERINIRAISGNILGDSSLKAITPISNSLELTYNVNKRDTEDVWINIFCNGFLMKL